jgi:hypothetical protein
VYIFWSKRNHTYKKCRIFDIKRYFRDKNAEFFVQKDNFATRNYTLAKILFHKKQTSEKFITKITILTLVSSRIYSQKCPTGRSNSRFLLERHRIHVILNSTCQKAYVHSWLSSSADQSNCSFGFEKVRLCIVCWFCYFFVGVVCPIC